MSSNDTMSEWTMLTVKKKLRKLQRIVTRRLTHSTRKKIENLIMLEQQQRRRADRMSFIIMDKILALENEIILLQENSRCKVCDSKKKVQGSRKIDEIFLLMFPVVVVVVVVMMVVVVNLTMLTLRKKLSIWRGQSRKLCDKLSWLTRRIRP